MYQHNMRIPIPFFLSERGYGVLIDCGCTFTVDDTGDDMVIDLECVDQLDFYVISGENFDDVIKNVRALTGKTAMLPKWAFGYVQSKEKYSSFKELCDVAKEYRDRDIPIDCVVQDWKTWVGDNWGTKQLDETRYPSDFGFKEKMKKLNVHSMVSVWPNMNMGTPDNEEMLSKGFLLNDLSTYNAFDEAARETYFRQAREGLYDKGFDSWWCDSTEPFPGPDWGGEKMRSPQERYNLVAGEHAKYLGEDKANLYSVYHARGMYENQRKYNPKNRVLNLTRSGYLGIQKYGTMLWSGDISAQWEVLRKQIVEGLNMACSAMPFWTLDIGGFFVVKDNYKARGCECNTDPTPKWFWHGDYENGVADRGYKELYTRWIQMGCFLPMFRSHGTDTPREIWNFGEAGDEFYDSIAKHIRLRYRLMPYIYSLVGNVVHENGLMIKPLLFVFPSDKNAGRIEDQYMFGDELMICPVTNPMYYDRGDIELKEVVKKRKCYLPKCAGWFELETGKYYKGGQWIDADAPLSQIPVFVKAGSIIPMEEKLSFADEKVETPLGINIYPGDDCTFKYYEDAGDGYEYENGDFNYIDFVWSEKKQELNIASCCKQFDNGIVGRKLLICCGERQQEIVYEGKEVKVGF